jgi:putative flippase GtrA
VGRRARRRTSLTRRDIFASLFLGEIAAVILFGLSFVWELPAVVRLAMRLGLVAGPLGALAVVWLGVRFGRRWPALGAAAKFVVVGVANTLIDLGVLNLLLAAAGVFTPLLFAFFKAMSFSAAVGHSFFWNRSWSFASGGASSSRSQERLGGQFGVFLLATLVGLMLNTGVATLLVSLGPPVSSFSPLLWVNVAAGVALLISTLWNFCAYRFFVFAPPAVLAGSPGGPSTAVRLRRRESPPQVASGLTES